MDKTKTLVILALSVQFLNGILFPQPTVCKGKGNILLIKLHKYITWRKILNQLIGNICGDKCAAKCTCGETFFDSGDALYCCIPKNETCRRKGQGQGIWNIFKFKFILNEHIYFQRFKSHLC